MIGRSVSVQEKENRHMPKWILNIRKPETCKYASDTGEVAFPAAPCRGNRIICQHPANAGFISYTKQCRKERCLYYEAEC